MGGRVANQLSQTPRAIERRAETRRRRAAAESQEPLIEPVEVIATPENGVGDQVGPVHQGGPVQEPIGVFNASKKPEVEAVASQKYHCANCQGEMTRDDSNCPWCEVKLVWEGIA